MVDQVCSPTRVDQTSRTTDRLGAVRNRKARCAIGDRLENWKRLGDRLPVFLTEAT